MDIACATDDAYAPHCGAMLESLFAHNAGTGIAVHVLHATDLSPANLERLASIAARHGARFRPLPVSREMSRGFPDGHFHISCWYRVLLPTLLPESRRILYLDSDLLVLDSLKELWETDLRGMLFGAVVNPLYPFMADRSAELGLPGRRDYLNSGVMLMDLEALRAADVHARVLRYAGQHPANPWPEQDALSALCHGRWLALPPRWNAQSTLFDLKPRDLPFTAAEIADATARPAIVHFIGPHKPWHYLCRHPLRGRYAEYRRRTPWPEFELEGRTPKNRLLRPLSLERQLQLQGLARSLRRYFPRGPRVMRAFARAYPRATFVQIGSNDGAKNDPLHDSFMASHWSGVMAEPVPYVFERLRANYGRYERVRLENVAVGTTSGSLPFYHLAQASDASGLPNWYDEVGSLRRDVVMRHAGAIPDLERRLVTTQVNCVTFDDLCRRNDLATIDLIHIDAEGYDHEILGSIDLARYRPALVIYEHLHLCDADRQASQARLRAAGYALFEEDSDTWAVDLRPRGREHRRLLRQWKLSGWLSRAR